MIDMELWDLEDSAAIRWLTRPPIEPPRRAATPHDARSLFRSLKRQYFFEAEEGEKLIDMLPRERRSFHELLKKMNEGGIDSAKQDLFQLLAKFLGSSLRTGEIELPTWSGLRYNALGQPTALVAEAGQALRLKDVVVHLPRLRRQVEDLVEYVPDHVRLALREEPDISLNIDLRLWLELKAIERGLPAQFRDFAVAGRLQRFLAAVAHRKRAGRPREEYAQLLVQNVESQKTDDVQVDLGRGIYRL